MDWMSAADAADELLAAQDAGSVVRDPAVVFVNEEVFAFTRDQEVVDDTLLVVERATGQASLVSAPPYLEHPFPGLVAIEDAPESLL